jgi:hypothetical protein
MAWEFGDACDIVLCRDSRAATGMLAIRKHVATTGHAAAWPYGKIASVSTKKALGIAQGF